MMVVGVLGVLAIGAIFLLGGESPSSAAGRFMEALGSGDTKKLTKMSWMDGLSPEQIERKWEYTTQTAGRTYRFKWQLLADTQPTPDQAIVRLWVWRDYNNRSSSYEEKFEVPLLKKDGKWVVDVKRLNRLMYPGLPR